MRAATLALLVSSVLAGCAARSGSSAPPAPSAPVTEHDVQQEFQPDRPDVANSTHVVPVGLLQFESGGEWQRVTAGNDNASAPLSLRLGLRDWLEARVETSVDAYESTPGQSRGLDGLSTGAKVSFSPAFAIIPAVQLPVGLQNGANYLLTLIASSDFGDVNHADVNYGVAGIAADEGHFLQQWFAVSADRQVATHLTPYVEAYWFSRRSPGGPRIVSSDFGFAYTLDERLAFDCGADIGLSHSAPRVRLFGGLTVILGEAFGHEGVHARLRDAAERHARRQR